MRQQGRVTEWNDDRGFGFVTPLDGGSRIFVHISAFPHGGRRPRALDLVTYEVGQDERGRRRATEVNFLTPQPTVAGAGAHATSGIGSRRGLIVFTVAGLVLLAVVAGALSVSAFSMLSRRDRSKSISAVAISDVAGQPATSATAVPVSPGAAPSSPANAPTPAEKPPAASPKPKAKKPSKPAASADDELASAFANKTSDIEVTGSGVVSKVLSDDNNGARHQRFILRLPSGQTLLVAHNIDIAPRLSNLNVGDSVAFKGEYVWNAQGGLLHWTHHDPSGQHATGWLTHNGVTSR